MKNLFILLLVAVGLSSCSKTEVYNVTVENVTVNLNSKELLETVVKPFGKLASTGGEPVTDDYDHQFPSSYTAYFISKETKGEYTTGDLVTTINVSSGDNTITVPKLDYDIIITNYTEEGKWYTWPDAIDQMPQTSQELYLYGRADIDYSSVTEGTVELTNPYAAVMISDNRWINGTPKSYDTNQEYFSNSGWYILYIRNSNTNTMIPISIAGNPSSEYTLSKSILPNNIYQFTIDGSVPNIEDGNLGVIVKPFEKVFKETINL